MVDALVVTVLVLTSVVVTLLNLFCLVVIKISPVLNKPSIIFIANLLATHFVQGILVIPSYTAKRWGVEGAVEKAIVCDIFRFTYMITNYGSCLTLLLIAVDRVLAVYRPYSYRKIMTAKLAFCMIFILWGYVFLLCLLPFIPSGSKRKCNYNPQRLWSVCMLIINTFLPFTLMAVSYVLIFKRLTEVRSRALSREIRKHSVDMDEGDSEDRRCEIAVAKMSLIVILAYIFCWGPSFFYYLIRLLCSPCFAKDFNNSTAEEILTFTMKLLTFFDGIISPCIYCFKHCNFLTALRSLRRRMQQRFSIPSE